MCCSSDGAARRLAPRSPLCSGGSAVNSISIIADTIYRGSDIASHLTEIFETQLFSLDDIPDMAPTQFTVVDGNLNCATIYVLREWLKRSPEDSKAIFVVDKGSRLQAVQACAAGATDLLLRPIDGKTLLTTLLGNITSFANNQPELLIDGNSGVSAGVGALRDIFASATLGAPLDPKSIDEAGASIVSHIGEQGFGWWIDTVRKHHSQTYQHCLIVTGVAVTFGRLLGFSNADQKRLATAGLLHDIGKARIPVGILEKRGSLNADETAIMKQHPLLGYEALQAVPGLHPEMLDMVAHHHEYLDGSGYPHGLQATELSDLVRTMTIADIFGALIERRSYKPPLSGEAAYQILRGMGPKVDKDLVREFRPVSRVQF